MGPVDGPLPVQVEPVEGVGVAAAVAVLVFLACGSWAPAGGPVPMHQRLSQLLLLYQLRYGSNHSLSTLDLTGDTPQPAA